MGKRALLSPELVTESLGRYSHPELCKGWITAWYSEVFPLQARFSWPNVAEERPLPQCAVPGGAPALLPLVPVQVHPPQLCGGVSSPSLYPGDTSQLQQPLDSPWV